MRHLPNIGNLLLQSCLKLILRALEQIDTRHDVQARIVGPLRLLLRKRTICEGVDALPNASFGVIVEELVDEGPACYA